MAGPAAANEDGRSTVPFTGPDGEVPTLGGEPNTLARNVAGGPLFAGVQGSIDAGAGPQLVQDVALLGIFADLREADAEGFGGYKPTTFDGRRMDAETGRTDGDGTGTAPHRTGRDDRSEPAETHEKRQTMSDTY